MVFRKTQFGDTKVEAEWYSPEVGIIKIDFDPDKNTWVGSWKFSLMLKILKVGLWIGPLFVYKISP